ncbi:MAG: hypothetical protein ABH823_04415 [bacterium]
MNVRIVNRIGIQTAGGTQRELIIHTPGRMDRARLADLHNCRTRADHETVLEATPDEIDSWLGPTRDPESLLIGSVDERPMALIRRVRRQVDPEVGLPKTVAELTNPEEVNPEGDHVICPWVTVEEGFREFHGEVNGAPANILQLMVATVKEEAQAQADPKRVFAYSRPFSIRHHLRQWLDADVIRYYAHDRGERATVFANGKRIQIDQVGVHTHRGMVVSWQTYWNQRYDSVLRLHAELGAQFDKNHVFPQGHIQDLRTLGIRIAVEHPLR